MTEQTADTPTRTTLAKGKERRATVRFPCNLTSTCGQLGANEKACWPAVIQDLSSTGIRLLVKGPFEPKSILVVECTSGEDRQAHPFLVKVVYVKRRGPELWLVGCAFSRLLREDEVEAVLRRSDPPSR